METRLKIWRVIVTGPPLLGSPGKQKGPRTDVGDLISKLFVSVNTSDFLCAN